MTNKSRNDKSFVTIVGYDNDNKSTTNQRTPNAQEALASHHGVVVFVVRHLSSSSSPPRDDSGGNDDDARTNDHNDKIAIR